MSPRPLPDQRPHEKGVDAVASLLYRYLASLPNPERDHATNRAMGQSIGRSERKVASAVAALVGSGLVGRSCRAPDRTDPSTVLGRVIVACSEPAGAA